MDVSMRRWLQILGWVWVLLAATPGGAEVPNADLMCQAPEDRLDRFRYLRSAALDITGTVPPHAWMEDLQGLDDVPGEWIDALLDSPEFADRVVRWHRAMVWNNLSQIRFFATRILIRESGGVYWVGGTRSSLYRGSNIACNDSPAAYDPVDGRILTDADGREGYTLIQPHWLPPGQSIKVCAFDAQDVEVSPEGTNCQIEEGLADAACGCGPNLIYCGTRAGENLIQEAFAEDLDRRVQRIIENDLPYTELFTGKTAFVNGPIVRYWRTLANFPGGVRNTPIPVHLASLPDLETWQDGADDWVEIELPSEHAGILTSPAWLMRFQTNRGRANQFYTEFLCAPLKAQGTLATADPEIQAEPNLQAKAGCNICHAVLEPAAAFWGRWTEAGAGYLKPSIYPAHHPECFDCATTGLICSTDCNRYYKVKSYHPKEDAYLGGLNWLLFQTEGNQKNVDQGPALMALLEFAGNRLPDCAARRVAERLLGRPIARHEQGWIDELVVSFAGSDFSYRQLVRAVVTSPVYRRLR